MNREYFMKMALAEAEKALAADEFPVGCVLVAGDKVVAAASRSGTAANGGNEIDHAEMLALRHLTDHYDRRRPASLTAFSTLEPCLMCLGALILNNVTEIVYAFEDAMGGATACDLSRLGPLYRQRRPIVVPHVLRHASLLLFKRFFASPRNAYWQNSFLARYTLAQ
jgi:tRNA(adenine34) deaminase